MAMSIILLVGIIGLGFVFVLILVVVLVVISRQNDFVNPFPVKRKETKSVGDEFLEIHEAIKPNMNFNPIDDKEAALVDWLVEQASAQTGVKLTGDRMAFERIATAARKVMKELDVQEATKISLPFLTTDSSGPKHFEITISRKTMEQLQ